jgi:hypothetical protein
MISRIDRLIRAITIGIRVEGNSMEEKRAGQFNYGHSKAKINFMIKIRKEFKHNFNGCHPFHSNSLQLYLLKMLNNIY